MIDYRLGNRLPDTLGNNSWAWQSQPIRDRGHSRSIGHVVSEEISDSKIAMFAKIRNQATGLKDVQHDLGEGIGGDALAGGQIVDCHPLMVTDQEPMAFA